MKFRNASCFVFTALFLLVLIGVSSSGEEPVPSESKKEEKLRKKEEKKRKKREKESKKRRRLPSKTLKGGKTAVEWYEEAMEKLAKKKYYAAREILLPLEENPKALDIQPEVKLAIADSYFYQRGTLNLTEAQVRYGSFLTFYPKHKKADYSQYRLALCFYKQTNPPQRDQGPTRRSISEFEKLLYRYPDSPYASDAAEKKREMIQLLADHEFMVGKHYFLTKAWNSAINRFLNLLKDYPDYHNRERVYFYLSKAYEKIGSLVEANLYASKVPGELKSEKKSERKEKQKKHRDKKKRER